MAVTPLKKIGILGLKEEREKFLQSLQEEKSLHVLDLRESAEREKYLEYFSFPPISLREVEEKLQKIDKALEDLSSWKERGMFAGIIPEKLLLEEEEARRIVQEFPWEEVCKRISSLRMEREELRRKRENLEKEREELSPFLELNIPPSEISPSPEVHFYLRKVKSRDEGILRELISSQSLLHLEEVGRGGGEIYFLILAHHSVEDIEEILRELPGEEFSLPPLNEIPRIRDKHLEKEIAEIMRKEEEVEKKMEEILREERNLKIVYDYYYFLWQREAAGEITLQSDSTFLLLGWVRDEEFESLRKWMEERFPHLYMTEIPREEEEEPPVSLKNPLLFRPFEAITRLYSLPRYGEVDPSPIMAPFFALFFGLCLTDAGYGVLLILMGLFLLRKLTVGKEIVGVILLGGVSAIFWGTITGGWFAIPLEKLPPFLRSESLIKFVPLKDLMVLFILALSLGILQIMVGIGVELFDRLRHGRYWEGIGECLSWLLMIPGLILYSLPQVPSGLGGKLFLGGLVLSLFSLPAQKNPWLGIILIPGNMLWKFKDFVGNVLSYSRLMALGLATGVIGMVVNTIGGIVKGIPFLGLPLMVGVLIGGHIFNLAINSLGAFVHTSRLQFVEFFPYFFEGGGKPFKPLTREGKYTIWKRR